MRLVCAVIKGLTRERGDWGWCRFLGVRKQGELTRSREGLLVEDYPAHENQCHVELGIRKRGGVAS